MRFQIKVLIIASLSLLLAACGDTAQLPEGAAVGPAPALPPPNPTLIPTVKIAPAKGWSQGMKPVPATDLSVDAYATGLDHPRWLHVLPNGDVLVAETNAPPGSEGVHGFKGMVFRKVQSGRARACQVRTASPCCATRTATASQKRARYSSKD